jgi:hypothetical protein
MSALKQDGFKGMSLDDAAASCGASRETGYRCGSATGRAAGLGGPIAPRRRICEHPGANRPSFYSVESAAAGILDCGGHIEQPGTSTRL